jgi:hypothetical protein
MTLQKRKQDQKQKHKQKHKHNHNHKLQCSSCGSYKTLLQKYKNNKRKYAAWRYSKINGDLLCNKCAAKEYKRLNPLKDANYRSRNRIRIRAHYRQYYQENRQKVLKRNKKYRQLNKEKIHGRSKIYRELKKKKKMAYQRIWYQNKNKNKKKRIRERRVNPDVSD